MSPTQVTCVEEMRCLLLCAVFLCTVPLLCLAQSPTPDLPSFPSDPLRINIEATIYRTNVSSGELTEYTGYYEEYRDSANNRGLAITFTNSSETRYYYDLDVKQGFNVVRGPMVPLEQAECTTHDIKTNENGFVEIFQFTKGAQNSLVFADTPTFFQWNPNALPIFQDITEVRGIPASSWFISSSDTSPFNLTYYFSNFGHH
ncbi:hypothetical protein EB796_006959 [Bugula neritina]|uniref:Uncharacterized protein n=1 Tax=Bugula neritina TaxID=10212 RepID=A0A7J7K951_BUGNE|nr:hypothetical protein EB796_006959 [Bugula neritina]